jgi:hypothetical protein
MFTCITILKNILLYQELSGAVAAYGSGSVLSG